MSEDRVQDDEWLYRRVRNVPENFLIERDELGRCRPSSQAFADRDRQPSVDRAALRGHDPTQSIVDATDFVALLLTQQVRAIRDVPRRDSAQQNRLIDVVPDPIFNHPMLPDNLAHALILATPEFAAADEKHFKKLKQYLARLAQWAYPPSDLQAANEQTGRTH